MRRSTEGGRLHSLSRTRGELLAPFYGWFTEGFDTLDLKETKALLDELTSQRSVREHEQAASSVRLRAATMPSAYGDVIKGRSKAGGEPIKARRRKASEPKRRNAPKAVVHSNSSTAGKETEVARLGRELREALEEQTATSKVLRVISSSPGDLQPAFAAMLENAVRICDAKFGNIHRWDGDALHLMATHNTPPAFAEYRATATPLPAALPLFAGGLGVLGLIAGRKKRKATAAPAV